MSRHDDPTETFDDDDSINDDLEKLVAVVPKTKGLNGYEETIAKGDMALLMECWEKIATYFRTNNNIHDGTYHCFLLSRYIIDEHEKKTYKEEISIHLSTEQTRQQFFK